MAKTTARTKTRTAPNFRGSGKDRNREVFSRSIRYADPDEVKQKEKTMAGYRTFDEATGEEYWLPYERPFIVRATPKKLGVYDRPEDTTITAFRTREEADEFLREQGQNYLVGPHGFASLHVENWNE